MIYFMVGRGSGALSGTDGTCWHLEAPGGTCFYRVAPADIC